MFNPLTPAELVRAVGTTARDLGRSEDPGAEFSRAQMLSAYSACRHIAVEMEHFGPEVTEFIRDIIAIVEEHSECRKIVDGMASEAQQRCSVGDVRIAGDMTCRLLETLRSTESEDNLMLVKRIQKRLAQLIDCEVELMSDAIEGSGKS